MKQKPRKKRYPLNQCRLYKCNSKKKLESILKLNSGELAKIDSIIKYHSFQIDKKSGNEKRDISAPDDSLKKLQSRILRLLQYVERPEWLISGEKGKCYIDNGKAHLKNTYMLALDIKKFYDNCQRNMVYMFFKNKMLNSSDVAKALTDIVTYQSGIPTGCPTSQMIAYYAYEDMFNEIFDISRKYNCLFTLYVDDMMFSSKSPFDPQKIVREIELTLRKYGHRLKLPKVKYYSRKDNKPITGTIVTRDHTLEVPNSLQGKIYNGFQKAKHDERKNTEEIQTLLGRVQAAANINPNRFTEIRRLTPKLAQKSKFAMQ